MSSRLVRHSRCYSSQLKNLISFKPLSTHHFTTSTSSSRNSNNEQNSSRRRAPPPIEVRLTESAGRGVFATRNIQSGELIHTAKPIVSHPSLGSIHSACYFCLKKLQAPKPISQNVSFCSAQCSAEAQGFYEFEKRADWSSFDDYCRTQSLKYPLIVKRLACMIISGAIPADSLDILQPATLSSGMISVMQKEFYLLRSTLDGTDIADDQMAFLTKQWYFGVLARIRINAFRVELVGATYEDLLSSAAASVEAEAATGNAIYMLPSFYNHDCDPNVHIIWIENADARLKALRDIEAGEELRICYIDTSMGYESRQNLLREGFGFKCDCLRCLSKD